MIISAHGSRFFAGQVDRIELGFVQLGHTLGYKLHNEPDLIYSNDASHYDEAIEKWISFDKKPKLILNILDVPHWLPQWSQIEQEWLPKLSLAHKVTCISKAVQNDVKEHLGINAEVIYNPIKPVYYRPEIKKDIFSIFIGRAKSPNKRVYKLLFPLYQKLEQIIGPECMHFVGSEDPGFGVFHGIVSDEELNILYNRSHFGLISSKEEGLNLPLIEMICTYIQPIVCNDMSTAAEFSPKEFLCSPDINSMHSKMLDTLNNQIAYNKICIEYAQKYSIQFSPKQIAQNILNVYTTLV